MADAEVEGALEKITVFLQRWYPPEIAPLVVKKQIQITGAIREEMTPKDVNLLLSRIEKVILPSFMSPPEARREIMKLRKQLGMKF